MTGTAIKTNGEGKPCTSHLNLAVSLADVWTIHKSYPAPSASRKIGRPVGSGRFLAPAYAGDDRIEDHP